MKIIDQNILEIMSPAVICHQVNCMGVMGGGLALQIRNKWQHIFDAYVAKEDWRLGDCQITSVSDVSWLFVANLAGQHDFRDTVDTKYDALETALRTARDFADANWLLLYIPYMMGCGLAGGSWTIVSEMIERVAPDAIICRYVPEEAKA